MKKYCVYELINSLGTVEYVGCTHQPQVRFNNHTKKKPGPGQGKFYLRQDLTMYIVKEFYIRKEAFLFEGELKLSHNMEWTEKTKSDKDGTPLSAWCYLTGHFIGTYNSMNEAARKLTELKGLKINSGGICKVLSGNHKQHQGMTFKRI